MQIRESISKFSQTQLNINSRCYEAVNVTRILQYSVPVAQRLVQLHQQPQRFQNVVKLDDLNIDEIMAEFKNTPEERVVTPSHPQVKNLLVQGLRQLILFYIKEMHSKLSPAELLFFYKNFQAIPCVTIYDLLKWYGFDCILNDNCKPRSLEEEKLRDSLAMEFVTAYDFADDVISSCMYSAGKKSAKRMDYTKNLGF